MRRKSKVTITILAVLSAILAVCLVLSVFLIVKLKRNNLFSKSIMLSNNYFLENSGYASSDEEDDVYHENYDVWKMASSRVNRLSETRPELFEKFFSVYQGEAEADAEITSEEIYGSFIEELTIYVSDIYAANTVSDEADRLTATFLSDFFGEKIDVSDIVEERKALIDVPYLSQEGILPNGCEAVSATMLLRFYGFDIDPLTFVDDYLKCGKVSTKWGCRYGPNPKLAYAGDPRSEKGGWGCFAPVIVNALRDYLPDGYIVRNTTGRSLNMLKEYIDRGIPVLVWGTVGMEEVDKILQWQSDDKSETFLYPANEHCMLLVGYDEDGFIFADPYESNGIVTYPTDDCVLAFNSLGMQSVVVIPQS